MSPAGLAGPELGFAVRKFHLLLARTRFESFLGLKCSSFSPRSPVPRAGSPQDFFPALPPSPSARRLPARPHSAPLSATTGGANHLQRSPPQPPPPSGVSGSLRSSLLPSLPQGGESRSWRSVRNRAGGAERPGGGGGGGAAGEREGGLPVSVSPVGRHARRWDACVGQKRGACPTAATPVSGRGARSCLR